MRKYSLTMVAIALLPCTYLSAQNYQDILRESQFIYGGTAKTMSMGGAVGALGGDFSAIAVNPAASGVYMSSEFSISPSFSSISTNSRFTGSKYDESAYKLGMGSAGMNLVFKSGLDEGLASFSFFVGYNRLNQYNQSFNTRGTSNSSMVDYFLGNISSSTTPADLDPYWEALPYDAYLIDKVNGNYVGYVPKTVEHREDVSITGNSGEWTFGIGGNVSHMFYFGASLNFVRSVYEVNKTHAEYNATNDPADPGNDLNYFNFNSYYHSESNGVNVKFGAIVRPTDYLRLGLSIHTPTFYKTNVDLYNTMSVYYNQAINGSTSYNVVPTDGQNYLPDASFSNKQTTPWRYIGSVALVSPTLGLLSVDYERVDYASNKIKESGDFNYEDGVNSQISSNLKAANNIRIGAECKVFNPITLRAGYAYYDSPYSSSDVNKNSTTHIISGGIGYYKESFFIDFAYSARLNKSRYYMYSVDTSQGFASLEPIHNDVYAGQFMATVGFRF